MCCGSWGRKESDTTEQLNWDLGYSSSVLFMVDSHRNIQSG